MLLLYSSVFRFDRNTNAACHFAECIYLKTLFIEFHQPAGPTEGFGTGQFQGENDRVHTPRWTIYPKHLQQGSLITISSLTTDCKRLT